MSMPTTKELEDEIAVLRRAFERGERGGAKSSEAVAHLVAYAGNVSLEGGRWPSFPEYVYAQQSQLHAAYARTQPEPVSYQAAGMPVRGDALERTARNLNVYALPIWTFARATMRSARPNVFRLTEDLCEKLLHTDVRGIPAREVRLPYEAIYIEIPRGVLGVQHHLTGVYDVECISVVEDAKALAEGGTVIEDGTRVWHWCAQSGSRNNFEDACSRVGTLAIDDSAADVREADVAVRARLLAYTDAFMREGARLLEAETPGLLADLQQRAVAHAASADAKFDGGAGTVFGEPTARFADVVTQLLLNLSLYLRSDSAVPRRAVDPELARLRAALALCTRDRTRVQIMRNIAALDAKDRVWLVGEARAGVPLRYCTLVRGHWRHQACGPRLSQRRVMWIQPHVRGPVGPAAAHEYETK
jgi:hypothetical protein